MLGPSKVRDLDHPVLVSLEALVSRDNLYRRLDKTLDLSFVRDWVKKCYADGGRPSIDPVVFFRLQLVLYPEGLRSERQLMRLATDRMSVRWLLGYGLNESLPDHSTLTRIRERYGLAIFRRIFDAIVEQCNEAGLVWGKELYCDATKVQANAALDSMTTRFAVDEHLRALFNEDAGGDDPHDLDPSPQRHTDAPVELAEQNAARHDWIAEEGHPERDVQRHAYRRVSDFRMSITDPDATLMQAKAGGPLQLGYHGHNVIDGGKGRIIVKVLGTPSEVMENQVMLDLVWQTCFRFYLWPHQVTADTTYGTIENIIPIEDAGIAMYTPVPDWDNRTPYFGASLFTYGPETDTYRCPTGKTLRRETAKYTEGTIVYRTERGVCDSCALKSRCTSSKEGRRIHRNIDEDYLDRIRAYHQTKTYREDTRVGSDSTAAAWKLGRDSPPGPARGPLACRLYQHAADVCETQPLSRHEGPARSQRNP
jgi:transposase